MQHERQKNEQEHENLCVFWINSPVCMCIAYPDFDLAVFEFLRHS